MAFDADACAKKHEGVTFDFTWKGQLHSVPRLGGLSVERTRKLIEASKADPSLEGLFAMTDQVWPPAAQKVLAQMPLMAAVELVSEWRRGSDKDDEDDGGKEPSPS